MPAWPLDDTTGRDGWERRSSCGVWEPAQVWWAQGLVAGSGDSSRPRSRRRSARWSWSAGSGEVALKKLRAFAESRW